MHSVDVDGAGSPNFLPVDRHSRRFGSRAFSSVRILSSDPWRISRKYLRGQIEKGKGKVIELRREMRMQGGSAMESCGREKGRGLFNVAFVNCLVLEEANRISLRES